MLVFVLTAIFAGASARSIRPRPIRAPRWRGPAPRTGWAPISWAATCSAASSTARGFRWRSGIGSTVLGCLVGVPIGLLSGYFGGWVDLIVQRFIDMMQSLPLLVTALVMAAALGPSLRNTIIAIAIPLVPSISRVVRSNTLALKEMPFIEAARAIGMSETWIAIRHVLPNTLAPLIVLATAQFGSAILVEASLSFLGLGVPEPYPVLGPHAVGIGGRIYAHRALAGDLSRASPSAWWCSAPTCWAMRCATCSIRGCDADAARTAISSAEPAQRCTAPRQLPERAPSRCSRSMT